MDLNSSKDIIEKGPYSGVILGFLMFCWNAGPGGDSKTTFVFVGKGLELWWELKHQTGRAEEGSGFQNAKISNQFEDFKLKGNQQLFICFKPAQQE